MNPERLPPQAGSCPGPAVLAEYAVGKLSDQQTREIANHVAGCDSCVEALEQIGDDDTLVVTLRRHVPVSPAPADPPPQAPAGPRVGPYELLEQIGQGAMGAVHKARHVGLNCLVALKTVQPGILLLEGEAQVRFRTEATAIARLDHSNIVRVRDYGEHDGQPYFSMELIDGQSLAQKLRSGPLPERDAADLVWTLALAVAYAHEKGVIHRDLKPANVLLTAEGAVKLSDFGLAKLLDMDDGQTQMKTVLGTPSYMAPEQARADGKAVGPLADVYGLGAILYEALAGRRPFRADTKEETLCQVQTQEPIPPSRLRPGLSRCLEAICLKCLEKDPQRRYASAAALADDLERYLQERPTVARPLGPIRRGVKAVRRQPILAAGGLLCVVGLGFALTFWYFNHPDRPVRAMKKELERGRAVVLVPEKGKPAWMHWRHGEDVGHVSPGPDEFSITCRDWGLVELVPDPQWERFLFRAEVKHDTCQPVDAEVGLYCAYRVFSSPGGPIHYFTQLTFNALKSAIEDWDRSFGPGSPHKNPPARPRGNPVLLTPCFYGGSNSRNSLQVAGVSQELFQPNPRGLVWRKLEIEVTPEAVRGWWGENRERVGELTAEWITKHATQGLIAQKKARPNDRFLEGIDSRLAPRGPVGLVIKRSSASFRRVVIEPLGTGR
jgi:serine/threonine-protein kinase